MNDLPSVSVVIPILNGAATIGETPSGLANQAAHPGETELIVVDTRSTDGTAGVVNNVHVTLLGEPRTGQAGARTRGKRDRRTEDWSVLA